MRRCLGMLALCLAGPVAASTLSCHYRYGGESKTLQLAQLENVQTVYTEAPLAIGSYFLLRPVFEPGAVKIYTWTDHPDGPLPLHLATYPHPAATRSHGPYGFTGEQRVYEPIRDSELVYWCEIEK